VAIYHLSVKTISRSAGRTATAAEAYRSASVIRDERLGVVHDFSRKRGVDKTFIVLPSNAAAIASWAADPEALWNAAEAAETRRNSTVAREYELALPSELRPGARRDLVARFVQMLVDRYGIVADVAIHAPSFDGDQRNFHAHVLTTTRVVRADGLGEKTRILDAAKTGAGEIAEIRAIWARMSNDALSREGRPERVDHRSLVEQGAPGGATEHLGPRITGVERRRRRHAARAGQPFRPHTKPARRNAERIALRAEVKLLEEELLKLEQAEQAERLAQSAIASRATRAELEAAMRAEAKRRAAAVRENSEPPALTRPGSQLETQRNEATDAAELLRLEAEQAQREKAAKQADEDRAKNRALQMLMGRKPGMAKMADAVGKDGQGTPAVVLRSPEATPGSIRDPILPADRQEPLRADQTNFEPRQSELVTLFAGTPYAISIPDDVRPLLWAVALAEIDAPSCNYPNLAAEAWQAFGAFRVEVRKWLDQVLTTGAEVGRQLVGRLKPLGGWRDVQEALESWRSGDAPSTPNRQWSGQGHRGHGGPKKNPPQR